MRQAHELRNRPLLAPYLAVSNSKKYGSAVYLCTNGRRHWVMDASVLEGYPLDIEKDLYFVSSDHLDRLRPGPYVPRRWSATDYISPPNGLLKRQMREIAVSLLRGSGVEVGALAAPTATPLECNTIYADYLSYDEIVRLNPGESVQNLVIPTVTAPFETLEGLSDGGLDYIIASHVIEHTRDPIGAIVSAYRKLRVGGSLVLVIPDKERTWDRPRPTTTLEHLVADYREPDRERDKEAYREFFTLCFPQEGNPNGWLKAWEEGVNIHFHTWTYETFRKMVDWIVVNAAPFSSVWSQPTLPPGDDADEFYFVLKK